MYCLTVDNISGKGEARKANTPLVERLPNYSELLDINMVWPVISDGELSLFTQLVSNSAARNRSRARESCCEGECKTRTADRELSGRVCQTQRSYIDLFVETSRFPLWAPSQNWNDVYCILPWWVPPSWFLVWHLGLGFAGHWLYFWYIPHSYLWRTSLEHCCFILSNIYQNTNTTESGFTPTFCQVPQLPALMIGLIESLIWHISSDFSPILDPWNDWWQGIVFLTKWLVLLVMVTDGVWIAWLYYLLSYFKSIACRSLAKLYFKVNTNMISVHRLRKGRDRVVKALKRCHVNLKLILNSSCSIMNCKFPYHFLLTLMYLWTFQW